MKDERTPKNTFEWAERIGKNPLYLTGETLSDLGDLLAHVRGVKLEAEMFCGLVNPPLDPKRQHSGWKDADFIERAVLDELKRRNVMQPVEVPQPAKAVPPAFADLFTSPQAMEKALAAALKVGIINEANRWDYGRKVGAIVIFWEFLRGRVDVVNRSHENNPLAIDSIAAYFGKPISDRTKRDAPNYRGELLNELRIKWEK